MGVVLSKIDDSLSVVMDYISSLPTASKGKNAQLRAFFRSAKAILRGNDIFIIVLNNLVKKQLEKDIGLISEAVQESYHNPMLVVHIEIAQNFSLSNASAKSKENVAVSDSAPTPSKAKKHHADFEAQTPFFNNPDVANPNTPQGARVSPNARARELYSEESIPDVTVSQANMQPAVSPQMANMGGNGGFSNQGANQGYIHTQYLPPEMNTASGGANPSMYMNSVSIVPPAMDGGAMMGYENIWNGGRKLSLEEIQNNPYFKKNSIAKGKTFENFVEGPTNQILYENCKEIARNPGDNNLNPYLVYGESGLGKTHILLAIGNSIQKQYPNIKLMYVSMQQFFNDFTTALNDYKVHKLRDRFASGVSIKVEPPDPDTRRRIILQKAKEVGIKLDKQSVEFITAKFASNIRILEGHIKTIAANIVGNRADTVVTVNLVKSVLKDPLAAKAKLVTVDNIKQTVADYFRITVADIDSKARPRNIAHPRMLAMVLARELTGQSYPSLGRQFGDRDHTTVINAKKKIQKLCEKDVQMKEAYENLKLQLVD